MRKTYFNEGLGFQVAKRQGIKNAFHHPHRTQYGRHKKRRLAD